MSSRIIIDLSFDIGLINEFLEYYIEAGTIDQYLFTSEKMDESVQSLLQF